MSNTQILNIINDSSQGDKEKIQALQVLFLRLDKSELLSILPSSTTSDTSYRYVLEILKIETLMINYPDDIINISELISKLNKLMVGYRHDMKEYTSWFIKIKIPDLQSDFQYLFKELQYGNFIDLINKKMLIINGIPKEDEKFAELVRQLNLKILELYLISSYDFRNGNILNYLNENAKLEDEEAIRVSTMVVQQPFVSKELLLSIINHDFQNGYFRIVKDKLEFDKLYLNILENNIIKLSKNFSFVKIDTAYEILNISKDLGFDLESFIFQMIINNKFDTVVKIDQLEQTIDFGDAFEFTLEDHIKNLGRLVNDVYLRV